MSDSVSQLVDHLFRHQSGRLVSHLVRTLGPAHVDLAEDVVQDALVAALRSWALDGVPANPGAWLTRVAKNRALDVLRRRSALKAKYADVLAQQALRSGLGDEGESVRFADELDDDVLRMIFACCHPEIAPAARGPLTLKLACGFGVSEIARAFVAAEATISQRIVRAKRQLRSGAVEIEVPTGGEVGERVDSVLDVLYLVFNEGYAAHRGENLVRSELVDEAIRLTRLLIDHEGTALPQAHALLSLMLLQASRIPARVDDHGSLVLLADQDRSRWDQARIAEGFRCLAAASGGEYLSEFHVQAAIAVCHVTARRDADTDWEQILAHYDTLVARFPSAIASLNRAVAISKVKGPLEGLAELDDLGADVLDGYYLFPATRGELLSQAGRHEDALAAFLRALELVTSDPERVFLESRVRGLS
ncbi:MAG: sigma-70 family RNA polymerase sigma factor [Planctomycetota bacterium]